MKKTITLSLIFFIIICLFPRERGSEVTATPSFSYTRIAKASWYSRNDPGIKRRTASNEIFNDQDLTCAMWGVAFGQRIRVTNLANGKSVIVRVNDRGPHPRFVRKGRAIDLSKEAFHRLGSLKHGLIQVQIEFL